MAKQPAILDTLSVIAKAAHFGRLARYLVCFAEDQTLEVRRKAFCGEHLLGVFSLHHAIVAAVDPATPAGRTYGHFQWFSNRRRPENLDELITQMTRPNTPALNGFIYDVVSPTVIQCCKCARVKYGPKRQERQRREHHEDWMSKPHHKR